MTASPPALIPCPRLMLERQGDELRLTLPPGPLRSWELGIALADGHVSRWPVREASPEEALDAFRLGETRPPVGFDGKEGFVLAVDASGITVGARSATGHFYALQALAQLATAHRSADGTAVLPPTVVVDWPALGRRAVHLCYHLVQPFMPYHGLSFAALVDRVRQLAHYRINAVLLELESVFPFQQVANVSNELAFSREQMATLAAACQRYGVEIIPMVQCLGHAYNVLRHPDYAYLRETAETTQQYCPSNPASRQFYLQLVEDVLEALRPVRSFHIGGDESRRLGECPQCRDVVAKEGVGALYGRHVGAVCTALLERGVTPLIWSDMMEHHPSAQEYLPSGTVVVYWRYDPFSRPDGMHQFVGAGRRAIAASGARFGRHNHTMFLYPEAMRGIATLTQLCAYYGGEGTLVTDWTKAVSTDLTLPCLVYGAACAWGDSASEEHFAERFAALHFGVVWDWPSVYRLLAQPVPYCEDVGSHLPDRLDRLDWSANSFEQLVLNYTRQDDRASTVERLRIALAEGRRARQILKEASDMGVDVKETVWSHLDLACRTQIHWARVGLAVDAAARLLKFPATDDQALRAFAVSEMAALLDERAALHDETVALLERTTFPPVARLIADFKLDPGSEPVLRAMAADLESGRQRSSLLRPALAGARQ